MSTMRDFQASTEQFYLSQDGATLLRVDGAQATVIDVASKQEIDRVHLRGNAVTAAISNHRTWIAAALESDFVTDICEYKKEAGKWSMIPLQRIRELVKSMKWEESDDSRHPPKELCVEKRDGAKMTLMPK